MVAFTSGDMFAVAADIRVNTVNCVGVMGAGAALEFRRRYPAMFRSYADACRRGEVRPGALHVWTDGDIEIVNLPTKRHFRNPSRYEDVESGLAALRAHLLPRGAVRVTMPAPGCGCGGLEWPRVSGMVLAHLGDVEADVMAFAPRGYSGAGRRGFS